MIHRHLARYLSIIAGSFLVLLGLIITPMPIPLGIILIVQGLSMLVSSLPFMRHWLRDLRRRYHTVSARLKRAKRYLPAFARRLIEDTDPGDNNH